MAINTKHDALMSLKPNEGWNWAGFDYKDLNWEGKSTKPTESEIDAELTRLNNLEPMTQLRYERNKKLAASDWRASSDLTLSNDWKTYRQALRDITKTASPKLDSAGRLDPTSVTFPAEPS